MAVAPEVDAAFKTNFAEAMPTMAQWSLALHKGAAKHTQEYARG